MRRGKNNENEEKGGKLRLAFAICGRRWPNDEYENKV